MSAELFSAAQSGDAATCQRLLQTGASANWADENGETPLMAAAHNGHVEIVEQLLAAGATVDAKDNNGWTALFKAAYNHEQDPGYAVVAKALIEAGANVKSTKWRSG